MSEPDSGTLGWQARACDLTAEVIRGGFRGARNGAMVARLEQAFARQTGWRHCIALCNGTATLHTALLALWDAGEVREKQRFVRVPPLTMSATTQAVLQAGMMPLFTDIDPDTWLMQRSSDEREVPEVAVSLYGLRRTTAWVDDAAQAFGALPEQTGARFASYSFQASKTLTCGEGGMLCTDDDALAALARSLSSLGYALEGPRIRKEDIKLPDSVRHVRWGWNYRMSDLQAAVVLAQVEEAEAIWMARRRAAACYREALAGCTWMVPQRVTDPDLHGWWTYAVRCTLDWHTIAARIAHYGGERPWGAWRLTYHEPAWGRGVEAGLCPVAEAVQPQLMQFQTNDVEAAERNAHALRAVVRELGEG